MGGVGRDQMYLKETISMVARALVNIQFGKA